MCNHKYQNPLPNSYKGSENCPIPQLFTAWLNDDQKKLANKLPLDSDGKCIFHSEQLSFRIENDVCKKFKLLLQAIKNLNAEQKENITAINLSELKIGGITDEGEPFLFTDDDEEQILIEAFQVMNIDIYFDHSIFYHKMEFYNCQFLTISFANVIFHRELSFMDSNFEHGNFHRVTFKGYTHFEQVIFNRFIDFSYSNFNSGLDVLDVIFREEVIFTHTKFRKNDNPAIVKFQGKFCKFTDFTDCIFDVFFILSYCVFEGEVNFNNAIFRSRLFVQKSEIHANFFFKKDSIDEPVFQDLVDFDLDPSMVTGKIIFENVSFLKINESHKNLLFQMAQDNKVEIGKGCIKYRLQTANKRIDLNADKQAIIIEFTQSFVNYFLRSSGLNLGLEIKERSKNHIIYFLFSDEDIADEEFHKRLITQERNFLKLLLPFDIAGSNKLVKKTEKIINKVDGFAALLSTCIKIGFRISLEEWTQRDTAQLMHAISFKTYQDLDSNQLHSLIATRFGQEQIINNYFIKEQIGLKLDQPTFIGGSHQFADNIESKKPHQPDEE